MRAMQPLMRGHGFQPLLPSKRSLAGGRWKKSGRGFVVMYSRAQPGVGGCYSRCYACGLTITCYWIPSSSPPPQIAAGERASGRRSGHQKASGRLMLQENDIKLWIWSHLLGRSAGGLRVSPEIRGERVGCQQEHAALGFANRMRYPT